MEPAFANDVGFFVYYTTKEPDAKGRHALVLERAYTPDIDSQDWYIAYLKGSAESRVKTLRSQGLKAFYTQNYRIPGAFS